LAAAADVLADENEVVTGARHGSGVGEQSLTDHPSIPWALISESARAGYVDVEVYAAGGRRQEGAVGPVDVAEQKVAAKHNRRCASDDALDPILADGHRAPGDAPNQVRGPPGAPIRAHRTLEIVEKAPDSADRVRRVVAQSQNKTRREAGANECDLTVAAV
jgi:hypothetical protein